jgi:transposase
VAFNIQTGSSNIKILTEYESVNQEVLLGNAVLVALMSGEKMTSYLKMATVQEKAMCVLWFFETKSVIKMQCRYRKDPPSENVIRRWLKQFQENGSVLHRQGMERPSTSQEAADRIQEAFPRSPQNSTRRASLQLGIPFGGMFITAYRYLRYTFIFRKQFLFYFILFASGLKIIGHGLPDNNLAQ